MQTTSSRLFKKTLLLLLPFLLLSVLAIALMDYLHARDMAESAAGEKAMAIAASGAGMINGDKFNDIRHLTDFKSEAYTTISHQLQSLCTSTRLRKDAAKTLRRKGNVTNFVVSSENRNIINQEFNLWAEMNVTFNSGEVSMRPSYKRDDHLYPRRSLARCLVELCALGRDAWSGLGHLPHLAHPHAS